jgi:hypothetical protein
MFVIEALVLTRLTHECQEFESRYQMFLISELETGSKLHITGHYNYECRFTLKN